MVEKLKPWLGDAPMLQTHAAGRFTYVIVTITESGEVPSLVFRSDIKGLEKNPYGDDVPVTIGSNQVIRRVTNSMLIHALGERAMEELKTSITKKNYECTRCGHVVQQSTNHNGPTWSWDRVNTCPACPPWAKYPEFGGCYDLALY